MRIAVSATQPNLDAEVDSRFGRCPYFVIVDPDTMGFEEVDNINSVAGGGAGIAAAQMIIERDIQVVLTGNCGPNAYEVLEAASIQVFTGISGKIQDVLTMYKNGELQETTQPNVKKHSGINSTTHSGMGVVNQPRETSKELESLKSHVDMISQQVREVQQRITQIERAK